jgi:hypothetical protein
MSEIDARFGAGKRMFMANFYAAQRKRLRIREFVRAASSRRTSACRAVTAARSLPCGTAQGLSAGNQSFSQGTGG